jgi:hypothetical protein
MIINDEEYNLQVKEAAGKVSNLIVRINNNVWPKNRDSYINTIAQLDNFHDFELMTEITKEEFMGLVCPWLRIFKPVYRRNQCSGVFSNLLMGRPDKGVDTSSSRGVMIPIHSHCLCLGFWPRHQKGMWIANIKTSRQDTYCEILFPRSTIEIDELESPDEYELFNIEKLREQGRLLPNGIDGGIKRENSWGNELTIIPKNSKISVHNPISICIF